MESEPKTQEWLDAALDNFRGAVESGDLALAKAIIADALDAGFPDAARAMAAELRGSEE